MCAPRPPGPGRSRGDRSAARFDGTAARRPALRRWTRATRRPCAGSVAVEASWRLTRSVRGHEAPGRTRRRALAQHLVYVGDRNHGQAALGQVARDHAQKGPAGVSAADDLREARGSEDQVEAPAEVELGRIAQDGRDRQPSCCGRRTSSPSSGSSLSLAQRSVSSASSSATLPSAPNSRVARRPPGQLAVVREVASHATVLEIVEGDALGPTGAHSIPVASLPALVDLRAASPSATAPRR